MSGNYETLRRLALTDPFVHVAMVEYDRQKTTYVDVLERLVIALSDARGKMCEAAIRAEIRSPLAPFTMPVTP